MSFYFENRGLGLRIWSQGLTIKPIHNRWNQIDYVIIIPIGYTLVLFFCFTMTLLHVEIFIFIEFLSFGGLSGKHEDFSPLYLPKEAEEGLNHVNRQKREGMIK